MASGHQILKLFSFLQMYISCNQRVSTSVAVNGDDRTTRGDFEGVPFVVWEKLQRALEYIPMS